MSAQKTRMDQAQRQAQEAIKQLKKTDTAKMRRICAMEADRLRERLK